MGWISGAVCALIGFFFLYKFYTRRYTPQPGNKTALGPKTPVLPQQAKSVLPKKQTSPTQPSFTVQDTDSIPSVMIESRPEPQEQPHKMSNSIDSSAMPPPPRIQPTAPSSSIGPARSASPPRLKPPTIGPAPPRPSGASLRPPPSAAASLRVPQQKILQNTSMQPSSLMPPPNKPSRQVVLEPGHSPLDWAALTSKPNNNLRGKGLPDHLIRVTPSQLKAQNGRKGKDAWTVYQGKVYNITPYVPFHPGGKGEILRGAAKDSVKLFMEVHPWVNWDGMLGECLVGILVGDEDEKDTNKLDELD